MQYRQKKRMPFAAKLALVCFGIYAAVYLVQVQLKINQKQAQSDALSAQIQDSMVENSALRQSIAEGASDEYIASIAREKLGYAYPSERKFVDASSK